MAQREGLEHFKFRWVRSARREHEVSKARVVGQFGISIIKRSDFLHFPDMISDASGHSWRHSERFMNPPKIVEHVM